MNLSALPLRAVTPVASRIDGQAQTQSLSHSQAHRSHEVPYDPKKRSPPFLVSVSGSGRAGTSREVGCFVLPENLVALGQ
jgi:hypothetical protein